jgi:hypothetical protein
MELVECIKDNDYHPSALKFIKNFPVKGDIYEVRKRQHTKNGLGYLLMEIENPIMETGKEPSFSAKRFKPVDSSDDLIKEIEEQLEYEY